MSVLDLALILQWQVGTRGKSEFLSLYEPAMKTRTKSKNLIKALLRIIIHNFYFVQTVDNYINRYM